MATKLSFVSSSTKQAVNARDSLVERYGNCPPEESDVIVALGGDGFMLSMQQKFLNTNKPIYGMNKGTVGFLMNEYVADGLQERIQKATKNTISPLSMTATDIEGKIHTAKAFNEVSLFRQSYQAASLQISINNKPQMERLICDGVLVATPAGSTAYNLSANGPILPLDAPLLALTPVSPFRPRRWRGALIPDHTVVTIEVNEPEKRPVNSVADHTEVKSVTCVEVTLDPKSKGYILFDPEHSWDDRVLAEQFQY